jgi:hypothetical protein
MDGEALRNLEQISEASYLTCLGSLDPHAGVSVWNHSLAHAPGLLLPPVLPLRSNSMLAYGTSKAIYT